MPCVGLSWGVEKGSVAQESIVGHGDVPDFLRETIKS